MDPFSWSASESETESLPLVSEQENELLYQSTFKGDWEKVTELYKKTPGVQSTVITPVSSQDTALHVAISDDREEEVKSMVESIVNHKNEKALIMQNGRGETPLHRAATRKSVTMCEYIVEAGRRMQTDLLNIPNKWGETPIFTAALYNRKAAFIFLHKAAIDICQHPETLLTRMDSSGDTVLHCVIRREHLDLAFYVIIMCPDLAGRANVKGETPLHVLAGKRSAFRSGLSLSWWKEIIYYCVNVDPPKYDPECCRKINENAWRPAKSSGSQRGEKNTWDPEAPNNSYINKDIPQNYTTCYQVSVSVYQILIHFMGSAGNNIVSKIREEKEKHACSAEILSALMENGKAYIATAEGRGPGRSKVFDPRKQNPPTTGEAHQNDKETEIYTPLLVAARGGVVEVVNKILSQLPVSIYDTTSKDKNILQVAVENRQPWVIEAVRKQVKNKKLKLNLWDDLIESVDTDDNTILHLAAHYDDSMSHPSQVHGVAMQMQWQIKWYEYVNWLSPQHFLFLTNKKEETPEQIFTRDHQGLVKDSSDWLKDTSESCSVVAALVAGVSFATSSAVPGGTNDETGKPTLEQQPAFEVFAITALMGLCFSVTALIMFLSILTSRKLPRDFKRSLPLKLLLGLSSLFVSIASMLISFCAAHFFVLEDKFKTAVFPLYAATCLPVSFYAILQFPLYVDLLNSIVAKVPRPHPSSHI
ncbi:uncharacterized protein LOC129295726 [Prosopis cineraria]|uniref:uncharacterized protein LOC129295726 n=1 Tax=Prosopis cineraria TaxID=364024 RepID=UPI00240EDF13|nr:uncharacterized protein LOC129295726 [Prosopis cineraria]